MDISEDTGWIIIGDPARRRQSHGSSQRGADITTSHRSLATTQTSENLPEQERGPDDPLENWGEEFRRLNALARWLIPNLLYRYGSQTLMYAELPWDVKNAVDRCLTLFIIAPLIHDSSDARSLDNCTILAFQHLVDLREQSGISGMMRIDTGTSMNIEHVSLPSAYDTNPYGRLSDYYKALGIKRQFTRS